MTPEDLKICYKIFHLPDLSATSQERKESYLHLDAYLSSRYSKIDSPTISITSAESYQEFNKKHHLLFPRAKFKWGELGIWASNLMAIHRFLASKHDYLILIEDDILVEDNETFDALLTGYIKDLPKDWDIFSYHCPENQFHKFDATNKNDLVVPAFQDWSMLCYLINKKGAQKLFNDTQQNGIRLAIDHHIFYHKKRFKTYTLAPHAPKGCRLISTESTFQNTQRKIDLQNFSFPIPVERSDQRTIPEKAIDEQVLEKVLVYKSYAGLGDIFFSLPAIYKLAEISKNVDFAVKSSLVPFFSKHLSVAVIDETHARKNEQHYDKIFELGNYPPFKGYDIPHAITYPSHKVKKQHAISHYLDAIANAQPGIDPSTYRYPYFNRFIDTKSPYFTIHHGAGFLLKIWPTEKYVSLIKTISKVYPRLQCVVIKGPDDPDIEHHFDSTTLKVSYVTGGMIEVGKAMEGALFHIGNDAGITHVAGAFNVPTVGIYGPTGPGSWGSFAQFSEIIWGKKGVCNLRCNYEVIIACQHRICLSSVSVERVMESLYKLLQKAYPHLCSRILANPQAKTTFTKKDCLIELRNEELLLEYHSVSMRKSIEDLIKNGFIAAHIDDDLRKVIELLKQKNVLFECPSFEDFESTSSLIEATKH
ncbi:MAG: glycosyltransferase family 9 protein [Bacteroidota bacterium]